MPLDPTILTDGDASTTPLPLYLRVRALTRLTVAMTLGLMVALATYFTVSTEMHLLITWNTIAWAYIISSVRVVMYADARVTRERARSQDQSATAIFVLVLCAAISSLVALAFLLAGLGDLDFWSKGGHIVLSVMALLGSWALVHLLFAFRYAKYYYQGRDGGHEKSPGGLCFSGDREPDYFDFVYYAFAVGMSSTTPDVSATTRDMRRLTLGHGILSFIFNICILGLSINLIASVI